MEDRKIYARILVNFLLTLTGVLLVIFLLPELLRFFLPFVIAFLISCIANPIVRFMEKKVKIVRKHGSAIMIIFVLGLVVCLLYFTCRFLVIQCMNLYADRYTIFDEVSAVLGNFADRLEEMVDRLPGDWQISFESLRKSLTGWFEDFLTSIELPSIAEAGTYVGSVAEVLFIAIITILAAYFLTAERDNLGTKLSSVMPKTVKKYYDITVNSFKKAVGGYFKAQFKIMLIIMAVLFVGFLIMGVNYALLLAALIAFLDFLPIFGTGTVFWPWMLIDLIIGDYKQAVFIGILYLACQLIKQLLQPKMVGDSIGVSPLGTLLYMFIGYRLGGVFGMIIGIPIGMLLVTFYRAGMFDRLLRGMRILADAINEFRKY